MSYAHESVGRIEQGKRLMNTQVTVDPRCHDAVLFDLDGVVTDTASIHAAGKSYSMPALVSKMVPGP